MANRSRGEMGTSLQLSDVAVLISWGYSLSDADCSSLMLAYCGQKDDTKTCLCDISFG